LFVATDSSLKQLGAKSKVQGFVGGMNRLQAMVVLLIEGRHHAIPLFVEGLGGLFIQRRVGRRS
jgi:predicted choloylglycine hydrolase